jgi:hypothetical protein
MRLARTLDPFSSSRLRKWGNLWCDGRSHYHGTDSMEVWLGIGLERNRGPGPLIHSFGCIE